MESNHYPLVTDSQGFKACSRPYAPPSVEKLGGASGIEPSLATYSARETCMLPAPSANPK